MPRRPKPRLRRCSNWPATGFGNGLTEPPKQRPGTQRTGAGTSTARPAWAWATDHAWRKLDWPSKGWPMPGAKPNGSKSVSNDSNVTAAPATSAGRRRRWVPDTARKRAAALSGQPLGATPCHPQQSTGRCVFRHALRNYMIRRMESTDPSPSTSHRAGLGSDRMRRSCAVNRR